MAVITLTAKRSHQRDAGKEIKQYQQTIKYMAGDGKAKRRGTGVGGGGWVGGWRGRPGREGGRGVVGETKGSVAADKRSEG